jgi:UTP--glucose-1-phosphate uridylyltransferase/phosphoglucomutase
MFPQVPLVKLDDKFFKLVDQMERLTPRPPSLVGASSLTVKVGDTLQYMQKNF